MWNKESRVIIHETLIVFVIKILQVKNFLSEGVTLPASFSFAIQLADSHTASLGISSLTASFHSTKVLCRRLTKKRHRWSSPAVDSACYNSDCRAGSGVPTDATKLKQDAFQLGHRVSFRLAWAAVATLRRFRGDFRCLQQSSVENSRRSLASAATLRSSSTPEVQRVLSVHSHPWRYLA